jgi:hypothetical protein
MALSYDPATILGFALEWFDKHEHRRPRCTCSTNANVTETLSTAVHKPECPVYAFTQEGWRWATDWYYEMHNDGH